MFCSNCGKQIKEGNNFCTFCGKAVTKATPPLNPKPESQPNSQPISQPESQFEHSTSFSGQAIASFVLSLVGLIIAAIPCGILGIVFSSLSIRGINQSNCRGIGFAFAGLAISIIDIIFGFVWLILLL